MDKPTEKYITLLGLFSHEYFHTWNIKRIKPKVFIPYQLKQESYTRQLWAFEGITSYYDDLGLIRSGVITQNDYLTLLGKNITRVMRGSGRLKQSMTESSFDAWTKFYKQDENAPNAIVSYYAKGAMFALCLDLMIRQDTDNRHSLDEVMRHLWQVYGKTELGLDDDTILKSIKAVTNLELDDFFNAYLSTTQDLPLESLLQSMGVGLKQRETTTLEDPGGTPSKPVNTGTAPAFNLGARFIADVGGAKVQYVYEGGCLQVAGIAANDVIVAVNTIKANKDNFSVLLQANQPGDRVPFHVFRRDELMIFEVELSQAKLDTYYLEADADTQMLAKRQLWLKAESQQATTST
jgi:predicted metalloprotease with PDZ domain